MLRFLKNKQGFTLIELVIIIILLGILAAIAIPRYVDLRNHAIEASAQATMAWTMMATHGVRNCGCSWAVLTAVVAWPSESRCSSVRCSSMRATWNSKARHAFATN